jgi:hypothetical protein
MPDTHHDPAPIDAAGMVPPGDPRAVVWNVIRGPWRFAAIYALAVLGCPGHLASGPLAITELAARCEADPAALERLLRCAASIGLLAQTGPECYALTSAGRALVPGTAGSMHAAILATGDPAGWQAMTGLAATARTGESAFSAQHGRGFYEYLGTHPATADVFQQFMTSRSADVAVAISRLDFTGAEVVADIGGGNGTILAAVLAAHPHLRGILFDRPHVVDHARDYLAAAGLTSRADVAAGDYLAGPLPAADIYLLASILHNHDDQQARAILGNVRAAATGSPRLLVADILLPDHPAPHIGCDLDVRMMALGTGRERTRAAYLALLGDAGLASTRITGTPYGLSIIDARPAERGTG